MKMRYEGCPLAMAASKPTAVYTPVAHGQSRMCLLPVLEARKAVSVDIRCCLSANKLPKVAGKVVFD
jgi:hypothetical protein